MGRFLTVGAGLLLALTPLFSAPRPAENTAGYSVQVSAEVKRSPDVVALTWVQDAAEPSASYTIYRKTPDATSWGVGLPLSGTTTSYVDTKITRGNVYEYRLVKDAGTYTGYGYITVGVEAPLVESRGKIVLVVDNTFNVSLAPELARLEDDLRGDGWLVLRRDVARDDSPPAVKAIIKAAYDSDPANVKSVFLFGHVPVPYSGQFNPDGHPDHVGAWPADVYYGDLDGEWTDSTINYRQTINTDPVDARRMSNVPGDGKFDQTTIPSEVELEVGRVDLANMPGRLTWDGPATFPDETALLRKYLNKDHNFRHRITSAPRRAILGDYFGLRGGEAFAASGFRSFAPLVGAASIRNLNLEFEGEPGVWIEQVAREDYLLAYGCGPGNYATMGGMGRTGIYCDATTNEMVSNNVRGVFNLLFGSWLGDWDHEDNFLRAPLATDYGLASAWSGRPHWFIHPLGTGATLGTVTRMAQNNRGLYQTQINSAANRVHIALMGDPTLRLHPVAPVENLQGSETDSATELTWSPSSDENIIGYHVYRADSSTGPFRRLTSSLVTGTSHRDPVDDQRANSLGTTYMVRAIKMETTPSGSYQNAAQGIFWSASTPDANAAVAVAQIPASSSRKAE